MNTKYLFLSLLATISMSGYAQEAYEVANIGTEDLNGSARYVGMGGAMDALGADISTIGSNPAGIALFRKSQVSIGMGVVSQSGQEDLGKGSCTNFSFDQLGLVWTHRTGRNSYLNFGLNYHKSRNFNQILNAANSLGGSAAHKTTIAKLAGRVFDLRKEGDYYTSDHLTYSQMDDLYENYLLDGYVNSGFDASNFDHYSGREGYIGEYDFNLSANLNNRLYLGLTIGLHDVHYKAWSTYHEFYPEQGDLYVDDYRRISGAGADIKLGAIYRPIEDSPLRFGLSVATPVFYELTSSNWTGIETNNDNQLSIENSFDYQVYTPWKFGLSAGHTIDNIVAIGVGYEYSNYNWMDARMIDGERVNAWGEVYQDTHSDENMNEHIDHTLKGVSTIKMGVEVKPMPKLSLRAGYNYVSPVYSEEGYKGVDVYSLATSYTSDDTFVNWKATNRFTLGVGYSGKHWSVDAAYQYSAQKGDFYAFTDCDYTYNDGESNVNVVNVAPKTEVTNNRNQFLLSVGYKF